MTLGSCRYFARSPSSIPLSVSTVKPPCGLPLPLNQLALLVGCELLNPGVAALVSGDASDASNTVPAEALPANSKQPATAPTPNPEKDFIRFIPFVVNR